MNADLVRQQDLIKAEKQLDMRIIDRFGLKADKPQTFDDAVGRLLSHKKEIIPPESEQNFINAIRNLQREAAVPAPAKPLTIAEEELANIEWQMRYQVGMMSREELLRLGKRADQLRAEIKGK